VLEPRRAFRQVAVEPRRRRLLELRRPALASYLRIEERELEAGETPRVAIQRGNASVESSFCAYGRKVGNVSVGVWLPFEERSNDDSR
jgi:hypothetical protein